VGGVATLLLLKGYGKPKTCRRRTAKKARALHWDDKFPFNADWAISEEPSWSRPPKNPILLFEERSGEADTVCLHDKVHPMERPRLLFIRTL
jgi:hypothetical protein